MGWADCGNDSTGRPIGYAFEATCDFPGCDAKIHRGLGYACGGMHGTSGWDCEKYFCGKHLYCVELRESHIENHVSPHIALCPSCRDAAEAAGAIDND